MFISVIKVGDWTIAFLTVTVLLRFLISLFSKLNKTCFGYFDPENIFLDNIDKLFSG